MRIRRLAILLSGLAPLPFNSVKLEQYSTDGDLAARWLADIAAFGDLTEGCTVADLGAGNGVLGLGALAMGAGRSILIEADPSACATALENADSLGLVRSAEIVEAVLGSDPIDLSEADMVVSNPPWGRQTPKSDRPFLDAMLSTGVPAHLLHSAEATHIQPLFEDAGWAVERYGEADFALPAAYSHHSRQRGRTRAAFWRLVPP
ncbi:MAG: RsmD family RNA methyltransferase [Candidatus Thermoplasmatota archaeon]|nr:RsmD family RNA methyltransferase [Candidatus Thermoplasmatota archaeon]|tara:strand:- start:24 stop:638 length:615 start_codon:yes stop_codon:yes gene_type:complete